MMLGAALCADPTTRGGAPWAAVHPRFPDPHPRLCRGVDPRSETSHVQNARGHRRQARVQRPRAEKGWVGSRRIVGRGEGPGPATSRPRLLAFPCRARTAPTGAPAVVSRPVPAHSPPAEECLPSPSTKRTWRIDILRSVRSGRGRRCGRGERGARGAGRMSRGRGRAAPWRGRAP